METILFERQEGMLCAQHALNMLLQMPVFDAVQLASIAEKLDEQERQVLNPEEIAKFKSHNYDDTGYFSIQVIIESLKPFDLRVASLGSPDCIEYRMNPGMGTAYICNLRAHWFTIRKFGEQWFHLNSLRPSPELISEASLNDFFNDLIRQGYSVFLIEGRLPTSLADSTISRAPIPHGILGAPTVINPDEGDEELAIALSLSEAEHNRAKLGATNSAMEVDDPQLQKALQESLSGVSLITEDELNKAIRQSLNEIPASSSNTRPPLTSNYSIEERRNAIEPNQAELIRQRRSKFLDKLESRTNEPESK